MGQKMKRTARSWRQRWFIGFTYLFILMMIPSLVSSNKSNFKLTVTNTHQSIECQKLRLDPGAFRCKRGDTTYKYKEDAIETVKYNGEIIYPYEQVNLTEEDLYNKDCTYLIEKIKSPLILENNPDLFVLVGTMYENGICTRQNVQQACSYYRRAGTKGKEKYAALRKKLI